MIEETLKDAEQRMGKAIDAMRRDLSTVRTGRANPSLVESLRVDYYGTPTPLQQLASVGVPEARLLTIQPYDKGSLEAIEKAIQKSDLGLNPSNDGTIIRLVIPQLTEDRRKELVRVVHKKVEDGRVSIRNVRRDAHEMLRDLRKEKVISDDHEHDAQEDLQKITDKFVGQASKIVINADPQRISQVLRNLLVNALTHTPADGQVLIQADQKNGHASITVKNTGAGIPPEDLPHIFDRFYRVDKSRSRSTGGVGLGLTITKHLVEAHGGTIEASSQEGQGTLMVVTLPLEPKS
ncbi:MAG: ribosome recycling factor [Chloroflexi bacterium]|nr:ribosome recycling factor [Chloroflexota bacterium]